MTDNNLYLISLGIVVSNIILGHLFAPIGIILVPVVISIVSILLVILNKNMSLIKLTLLILSLIILNDLGLLFFAGGTLDKVGLSLHNLFLLISYILSFIVITIGFFTKYKDSSNKIKLKSVLFSFMIFAVYFAFKMVISQCLVVEY